MTTRLPVSKDLIVWDARHRFLEAVRIEVPNVLISIASKAASLYLTWKDVGETRPQPPIPFLCQPDSFRKAILECLEEYYLNVEWVVEDATSFCQALVFDRDNPPSLRCEPRLDRFWGHPLPDGSLSQPPDW